MLNYFHRVDSLTIHNASLISRRPLTILGQPSMLTSVSAAVKSKPFEDSSVNSRASR